MKKQLDVIQVFRGIAAIMVVFHHIIPSIGYFQHKNYEFLNYFGAIGKYGVDFFFILSGFIITYSNYNKQIGDWTKYLKNRIIRIYVPFIPISIAMILLYQLMPNLSENNRNISLLTSLTLFPHGEPALAVAWTLTFEMLFYLLFLLFLVNKNIWNVFVSIWFISIVSFNLLKIETESPILLLLFSVYNVEFILGYLLGVIILKREIPKRNIIISLMGISAILFIVFKFLIVLTPSFLPNILFVSFAFFLIYYFVGCVDIQFSKGNKLMIIGNATYSIYLIHGPVHVFLERFLPPIPNTVIYFISILGIAVICIFAGYIYYWIFEKKLMSVVKAVIFKGN